MENVADRSQGQGFDCSQRAQRKSGKDELGPPAVAHAGSAAMPL